MVKQAYRCGRLYGGAVLLAGTMLAGVPALAQTTTTDPAPTAQASQEPGSVASDAATRTGVEEIIVTAQKREQNLQSVPISVTALTGTALVANRVADVRDLSAIAPNLLVRTTSGGAAIPTYTLRGVLTIGAAPGQDRGVSLYLDGVYLQQASGAIFSLADVERIEVLKGPQGTLFGRNSTGGAISITTRNPTGKFGVRQELSYGNFRQFRSKTRVDLPALGPLSASATYVHQERRGDTRNLGAGTRWDYSQVTGKAGDIRTSPKYLGNENIEAIGLALRLDLVDGLDISYKFDYAQNDYSADAEGVAAINTALLGPAFGPVLAAQLALQPNPANLTQISKTRPRAVNNAFTVPAYQRNVGHNLTMRYQLSDEVSIKNILAYRTAKTSISSQLDGLGGLVNFIPQIGPVGAPFVLIANESNLRLSQTSNETQLNVDTQWFDLTTGFIYFRAVDRQGAIGTGPNTLFFSVLPNFTIPSVGSGRTRIVTNSIAAYLQPELHVTSNLDLVAGARLTRDKKDGVDNSSIGLGVVPVRYRQSKPTYLLGVNYSPSERVLAYAKYSTGYISGGFLATRSFDPETSESYEIGVKADLLDRKLRTNLAVYKVDYAALQYTTGGPGIGIPLASQVVISSGDAKAKGFEFESTFVPTRGLTLQANVGYTDFKYTRVNPFLGTTQTFLPINRPKWTGNASAQYETEELFNGGHVLLRGDVNYQSKTFLAFNLTTPQIRENTLLRRNFLVNGRLALTGVDVGGGKAEIALWGRNILDNHKLINVSTSNFIYFGSYQRERTFGVDVSFQF